LARRVGVGNPLSPGIYIVAKHVGATVGIEVAEKKLGAAMVAPSEPSGPSSTAPIEMPCRTFPG
jgi:hypothetical protein